MKMTSFLITTFITLAVSVPLSTARASENVLRPLTKLHHSRVILISFDGFRFGYQYKTPTPNIQSLIASGTEAQLGLIPVFPSFTFPNHYSIATGLYPAHHGIVNNDQFVDPATGDVFNSTTRSNPKWWLGEPIWETVVNQGYNAAVYFWIGGEAQKGSWNCPPKFCPHFNPWQPFEERVDNVLSYFDLPEHEIPVLTALYFPEPDKQGHVYGPDHPEISKAVAHIDSVIGRLIQGLEERGVFEDVTIILVGDHGMVGICEDKYIYLEDLAPWIVIPSSWVQNKYELLALDVPSSISAAGVVAKMNRGLMSGKVKNGDRLKVYLKEDLPSRFHYSASNRITSVVGIPEEGYIVIHNRRVETMKKCGGGGHGYDNELFSMRSIFVGHGPRFEKGKKVASFMNIQVYNIIANILKLKGAPNNGSVSFAESILLPSTE